MASRIRGRLFWRRGTATAAGALLALLACDGPTGPLAFDVTPASLDLTVGDKVQLAVVVRDADGRLVTERSVTYWSHDPAVVTVSTTGLATAVGSGTTAIALSAKNVSGSVPVTVVAACGPAGSLTIEVTPDSLDLIAGETSQLSAVVRDTEGRIDSDQSISYQSEDARVATVSTRGLVTTVSSGSTSILASAGPACASVPVTVAPTVTGSWTGSVSLAPGTAGLRMTLSEILSGDRRGEVSGTGWFSGRDGTLAMTVTGTRSQVSVNLAISISGYRPFEFHGTFSGGNKIVGQAFGSGFTGQSMSLQRELGALLSVQSVEPELPESRPPGRDLVELLSADVQRW